MMKILWLTNIPSPYRVDFFNELGKNCQLTVLFERDSASDRDDSWKGYHFKTFDGVILKGIKYCADAAIAFGIFGFLNKKYDRIIVSNPLTITGMMAIFYLKLAKKYYIVVGDGGQINKKAFIKPLIMKMVLKAAKLYMSTGEQHKQYYLEYGGKADRIVWYPFTSIKEQDILAELLSNEEKRLKKMKLEIKHDKVILLVGQFIFRKGFDVMIKACQEIEGDVGVYFIGGEPTPEYMRLKNDLNLSNIYFVGFKSKEEMVEYYKASDIFVLPTRYDIWGLVINEAMSYGLPIITTNKCVAGLELINNDENGYIIPVESTKVLSNKINHLLKNEKIREKMSFNNLEKIKKYTIEKMVERHIEVFKM